MPVVNEGLVHCKHKRGSVVRMGKVLAVRLGVGCGIGVAVFASIIWLDLYLLMLMFGILALWVVWEWAFLCEKSAVALVYPALCFGLCAGLWLPIFAGSPGSYTFLVERFFMPLLYASVAWWFIMFLILVSYQEEWRDSDWLGWFYRIGGVVTVSTSLYVIFILRDNELKMLVYLFGIVALVDTAAYLSGRFLGQRKFMPEISPQKTYAGLWGALGSVLLVSIIVAFYFEDTLLQGVSFVLVSLIVALFAVAGDFAESLLKRRARVKDSGHTLPGHGGLLDRADSFLAAAPMFVFTYYVIV